MAEHTILEVFGVKDVKDKEVGIEIEMEGCNLFNEEHTPINNWKICTDNSLRGEAREYVFKYPVVRSVVPEMLELLQEAFQEHGSKLTPSDRCGVHVHINCQKLTTQKVINFAMVYYLLEGLLMKWCGELREGNIFTMRLRDAEATIPELILSQINGSLSNLQQDAYRYSSLNFSSLSKYGSLEFRGMQTPKRLLGIMVWVNMLLAIKDRSLMYSHPRNIIEAFSVMGAEGFLKHILEDQAEQVMCKNFEKIMYESARLIQDVAYCEPLVETYKNRINAWMAALEFDRDVYNLIVQAGHDPNTRDDYWPTFPAGVVLPVSLRKEGQRVVIATKLYGWYKENGGWVVVRPSKELGLRKPVATIPGSGEQPILDDMYHSLTTKPKKAKPVAPSLPGSLTFLEDF